MENRNLSQVKERSKLEKNFLEITGVAKYDALI
jgi:hypothetical protein